MTEAATNGATADIGRDVSRYEAFQGVMREVLAERALQDDQWGGPDLDDMHGPVDWLDLVEDQVSKTMADGGGNKTVLDDGVIVRARLIKIAALAVAGVQSIDRKAQTSPATEGGAA